MPKRPHAQSALPPRSRMGIPKVPFKGDRESARQQGRDIRPTARSHLHCDSGGQPQPTMSGIHCTVRDHQPACGGAGTQDPRLTRHELGRREGHQYRVPRRRPRAHDGANPWTRFSRKDRTSRCAGFGDDSASLLRRSRSLGRGGDFDTALCSPGIATIKAGERSNRLTAAGRVLTAARDALRDGGASRAVWFSLVPAGQP